jgi:hypothetical protein
MGASALIVAALFLSTVQSEVRVDAGELARRVKPVASVFVIDTTGAERAGTVADVSARGVTLVQNSGARFTVPLESIERVERTDSLLNGFIIGAAFVPTLYAIGKVGDSVTWTEAHTYFTAFYAVIGVWCDWLRDGRTNLYRVERSPGVSFAPVIGPRAIGAGVRVTF